MKEQRYKGYVIGCDEKTDGKMVWKVRVKDGLCSYNGKKLAVASVHGDIELAAGLNVNFAIGTVDDPEGEQIVRAVDVRLEEPNRKQ